MAGFGEHHHPLQFLSMCLVQRLSPLCSRLTGGIANSPPSGLPSASDAEACDDGDVTRKVFLLGLAGMAAGLLVARASMPGREEMRSAAYRFIPEGARQVKERYPGGAKHSYTEGVLSTSLISLLRSGERRVAVEIDQNAKRRRYLSGASLGALGGYVAALLLMQFQKASRRNS